MSITGNLKTLELTELLQWLAQGQKTGALVIQSGEMEKRVYFRCGKIIFSESNNPDEHLGSFLIREGLIDEATLARAVKLQESTQILLGKVLVTLGTITEDELHRILQRKTEESIYDLFNWTEGEFQFVPDELPDQPMVPIKIDVTNVVLEGAKRLDEARRDSQETCEDRVARHADEIDREIDDVLGGDLFQEVDLNALEPAADTVSTSVVEPQSEPSDSSGTDVRGYYGGGAAKRTKTPLLAAAAALLLVVFGASAYFFFLRPDPAAGTADRASLEKSVPTALPGEGPDAEQGVETWPDDPPDQDLDSAAAIGEIDAGSTESSQPDPTAELQARYEAELATLKAELEQAQGAAAERDAAIQRLRELEELERQAERQAELQRAMEAAREAEPEPAIAAVTEPESELAAGGDEPPTLGSTLPASEAASQAGNEFATEMVESTPPEPLVEPVTVERVEPGDLVEQGPEVTTPVLISQPQPRYPTAALRLGKEADVTVRLLVNHEGRVVEAKTVGRKAGMGFDQQALAAAKRTAWQPATKNGVAVSVWTELTIKFRN